MQQQEGYSAAIFWGFIAAAAVVVGAIVAVLSGYLLGHFTHERTKIVAARTSTAPANPGAQGTATSAVVLKAPVGLPNETAAMTPLGGGVSAVKGLTASVWARGVKGVADMAQGPDGSVFVSTAGETGKPVDSVWLARKGAKPVKVIAGLTGALGVAWHDQRLYVSSIGRVDVYSDFNGRKFGYHRNLLSKLPGGKLGYNDNLRLGPDGRFYMAIGSPCDHCAPKDPLSATIVSFLPDGSDLRTFSTGVRGNASLGFAPGTSDLYMATNQRNDVGGKPVPDQFGLVQPGSWWGYPTCWDQGGDACRAASRPLVNLDPHAATFGLAFVNGQWGDKWGQSALMSEWTLGKVIAVKLARKGTTLTADPTVVLTGLKNPGPLLSMPGGTMLASSQAAGIIYALRPGTADTPAAAPSRTPAATSAPGTKKPAAAGSVLKVSADPAGGLKYTTDKLTAKAGNVEVQFTNAAATPHDVVISKGSKVIVQTDTIARSKTSKEAKLTAGTYTFYCSLPGHRQAGMEGTLTVR